MGWVGYVARGRQERCIQVLVGNLSERDHLEDIGVDGRIISKFTFKKWDGGMDWIDLARGRDRWPAVVSAVMNFRVS